jgi:hypothetical protein
MVRTQIQLTEEQAAALRAIAAQRQVSIAGIIRTSIDDFLKRDATTSRKERIARAKSVAGRFSSGKSDVSAEHDRHLVEAFEK